MTTDEKPPATPEEKRAHVTGLIIRTARLAAKVAQRVGDADLDADASALIEMAEAINEGVFRGRVNENVRELPGKLMTPEEVRTVPARPPPKNGGYIPRSVTAADYEREGGPPEGWRKVWPREGEPE